MDDINVSFIHGFDVAHNRINPHRGGPVNSGDGDPISGLHRIDQIAVSVKNHGVGGLPGGHVVGRLLQLDHLLIAELRPVVDQSKAVVGVAVRAQGRFGDAASFDLNRSGQFAHRALEESLAHFRHEIRSPDDHPGDGDEPVDVLRVEGAHIAGFVGVERSHLDLVAQHRVGALFEEEFVDGHVQHRDDFLRVTEQLLAEFLVEHGHVADVEVKERDAQSIDLQNRN